LARFIRWQILLFLIGVILLGSLIWYGAVRYSTVVVPAPGGTYVEAVAGNPRFINPLLSQFSELDEDLCALMFNGLTAIDEQGNPVPDLAERWEISEDGLTYTFYLRQGVRWHDGAPFTADDVIFTIKALQSPDFPGLPSLAEVWRNVEVAKEGAYKVRFTLKEPFAPFITYTSIGILPAHIWSHIPVNLMAQSRFNLEPVGTGPFRLKELDATHILLEANPAFYGPKPYINQVEFKFYPDYERAFEAYRRGEVKGVSRIPPQYMGEAASMESLQLFSGILSGYTLVVLNLENPNVPFFKEREVRQALLYGIDRQAIADEVLKGQGIVAHSPILPNSWAYNPAIKHYDYDPDKAAALLEQAGWKDTDGDGIREKGGKELAFVLLTNSSPTRIQIAQMLAEQWHRLGVKAVPQILNYSELVRDFLYPRNFEAAIIQWELGPDPDPYPLWHSSQKEDGQNFSGYASKKADALLEEARLTPDQERRRELYLEFQEIFAEDVPALLLYYPVYIYGVDKGVKRVQIGPMFRPADRFRTLAQWYITTKRVLASEARLKEKP